MTEEVKFCIDETKAEMEKAISHLETELSKIRAGKATPQMLDKVFVDYYGVNTPLYQVANINTPDPRTIVVQPWEKSMVQAIEKGIQAANLGFNPQNDGTLVRINVPPLTEDRRKDLVKKTKVAAENTKVTIRGLRKDANEMIDGFAKDGLPEDEGKEAKTKIQELTDAYNVKVDKHLEIKEKEIMTV